MQSHSFSSPNPPPPAPAGGVSTRFRGLLSPVRRLRTQWLGRAIFRTEAPAAVPVAPASSPAIPAKQKPRDEGFALAL